MRERGLVAQVRLVAELHGWLAEQLPRFMVPRYLEARADLPRTPSQRVEKYKLRREGVTSDTWDSTAPD